MSRKYKLKNNNIYKDKRYNSYIIGKFINLMMMKGKKYVSEKIIYKVLDMIKIKFLNQNELNIFENVINNLKPIVEIRSRKIGGNTYQVPQEIEENRGLTLAIKWIILAARKRKENNSMDIRLFNEINDILDNKGDALKKRDELYRQAEANKAFAHYRW